MYMKHQKTSWGKVADWYDELLEKDSDSYQQKVILPNVLRMLAIKNEQLVLDIACGQGFFAREFYKKGAKVIGVDIARELIDIARKKSPKQIQFHISSADNLSFLKAGTVDAITAILAIQNIENFAGVFKECGRVLGKSGRLLIVLNHPAFRIPEKTSWGFDADKKIQYRRIDGYLSESRHKIQMHPSDKSSEATISFHRPLQLYIKALAKQGFAVAHLEEWISHKTSQSGPRAKAEDAARKEIPLFLCLEAIKTNV